MENAGPRVCVACMGPADFIDLATEMPASSDTVEVRCHAPSPCGKLQGTYFIKRRLADTPIPSDPQEQAKWKSRAAHYLKGLIGTKDKPLRRAHLTTPLPGEDI